MSSRCQYLILLFVLSSAVGYCQDSTLFMHVEAGADGIGSEFVEKDYFREISNQNSGFFGPRIESHIEKYFAGVKLEKKTNNNKFGFSTGVRFTHLESTIVKSGGPDFFYLLLRQSGTTTEYLQLRQLTETSNYLGVPLEVAYYAATGRTIRFCFTAGLEWSYQLNRKLDVLFRNSAMEIHQSDVAEIIGEPASWYATFYARPGVVIGKTRPVFSVGVSLPVVISNTVSNLNMPVAGSGIQIQFYLPLRNSRI